jgi:hypothetical protein
MDLFKDDAAWKNASNHVHIFKFSGSTLGILSDAQLRQAINFLNAHNIALAIEQPSLTWTGKCGNGIEGFTNNAPANTLQAARRIRTAGGKLRFIAMDEPFTYGSAFVSPTGCGIPVEKVAQDVNDYIKAVNSEFPDIIIGDIEWAGVGVENVKGFLESYRKVAGSNLPFLHWDFDGLQQYQAWPEQARLMETFCREQGISFGMIYTGNKGDQTDATWLKQSEDSMVMYETQYGQPDHIIFQSWHEHPHYLLPETDPTKYTYLINRYFDVRTAISVSVGSPSSDGSRIATGKLTDSTGVPIAAARVELSITPMDGSGQFAEYTLTNTVPTGASQAVVGFRVNTECDCARTSDFVLYGVTYREGSETAQRVANGDFGRGLQSWTFVARDVVSSIPSDRGTGQMLHIATTATQKATINSATFPVTAGATYTVTFAARVAPTSIGSGYFAIFFLDGSKEVSRKIISLEPATTNYDATTNKDGVYRLDLNELAKGRFMIQVKYGGDSSHWSTYARIIQ